MRRNILKILFVCLMLNLFMIVPMTAMANTDFYCYTYDEQNHEIDGYYSENDDTWYLFLTSSQSVTGSMLYYDGNISNSSNGELDTRTESVSEAFAKSGDMVELTDADGNLHRVVALQSKLPSVYINLNNTTLENIHADKDKKHKNNSIYITSPDGEYNLIVENGLEIKGRGNSTWREYEKKAYQIKFDDKISVLGMGKAKKWVLLANASDDSMMRTKLVYDMAENMNMDYVCDMEYVDLWIEGDYRGTFLLGEKVELGSSRLNLANDAGALFEQDEAFYEEEDYWFYSTQLGRHFVMKEIVEEEDTIIAETMTDFEVAVDELAEYLYSTPSKEVTIEALSKMIDVDSFAKYYLVNEFVLNRESFATSFYWYKDGPEDVLHLGPIWDFDTCMGNDGAAYTEQYGSEHVLFRSLLAAPEFYQRTQELWELYRNDIESMADNVEVLEAQLEKSATMNYLRWDVLGKPNPKGGADFLPTFDAAADTVYEWLNARGNTFEIEKCSVVTAAVNADCSEMELCFQNDALYSKMMFAVWSEEGGKDDIVWHEAYQDENGMWRYIVDLRDHNSAGMYRINAYLNDSDILVASGRVYVENAKYHPYQLQADISNDYEFLNVTMQDTGEFNNVRFAVWTTENGQDDLKWYTAEKENAVWKSAVDLYSHETAEQMYICAYGGEKESFEIIDSLLYSCVEISRTKKIQVPMHRYYNPNSGEHFYTGSIEEGNVLVAAGWQYEGIAWNAPIVGLPIYRIYNPNAGDHHYTGSMEEVENLLLTGWQYEGIAWNTPLRGIGIFRLYNPNAFTGVHHYTPSNEERDYLVSLGWQYEGVAWNGAE